MKRRYRTPWTSATERTLLIFSRMAFMEVNRRNFEVLGDSLMRRLVEFGMPYLYKRRDYKCVFSLLRVIVVDRL